MKASEVDKEIDGALALIRAVRDILINQVKGFPDNPRIDRVNSKCFTMSISDLSDDLVLAPEYYDFRAQYEFVALALRATPLDKIGKTFREIVETGKARVPYRFRGQNWKYQRLHPDVIENLKPLL